MAIYFKHSSVPGKALHADLKDTLEVFNYVRPSVESSIHVSSHDTQRVTGTTRTSNCSFQFPINMATVSLLQALVSSSTMSGAKLITTGSIANTVTGLVKDEILGEDIYQNSVVSEVVVCFKEDGFYLDAAGHMTQHITVTSLGYDTVKFTTHSMSTSHGRKSASASVISPASSASKK